MDVIIEGEKRLIIDIDFRSEFDIARSTKAYKQLLLTLPNIFVGKTDRLEKIIGIVSEAAKQSLKKKGMPLPPWRKADYVKAKWLSPFTRIEPNAIVPSIPMCNNNQEAKQKEESLSLAMEKTDDGDSIFVLTNSSSGSSSPVKDGGVKDVPPPAKIWELPEIKPKSVKKGVKMVTGLASVIKD